MPNVIKINDLEVPQPKRGLEFMTATLVDSARNANGVVVGQRIGRDQAKLNNLEWGSLTAQQWSDILKELEKFYVNVTYPDMVTNTWKTRKMYPGDRTATPQWIDPDTGMPTVYVNCKVNLIDVGSGE